MEDKSKKYVVEGEVTLGSYKYPIFVDQKVLGPTLVEHFRPQKIGDSHRIGRSRVTIELLED